ncbi:MAG: alpha/beta hydrolase [Bryobacteraceae bacterium]
MPISSAPEVLIVPGLHGSGRDHWQTIWEGTNPSWKRVEQRDWHNPVLEEWVTALENAVRLSSRPPVLVAHSLGCIAVAHWAVRQQTPGVAAALLVAPADVERPGRAAEVAEFTPIPRVRLPFPATLVASENDSHCTLDAARAMAVAWGSRFVNAGCQGHINVPSGHGPWTEGVALFQELLVYAAAGAAPACVASGTSTSFPVCTS